MTKEQGFTLAELAVVLVVIGLLLGGLMVPLAAQTDIRYRSDTEKTLADIREALIGFAIVNGRLPCPATATIASGDTNAGVELTIGSGATLACSSPSGVLPWATLGVSESDGWGRRFSYYVDSTFSRGVDSNQVNALPPKIWTTGTAPYPCVYTATNYSVAPANSAFALCSYGSIIILTASSGGTTLANGIPVAVVSHGKNGLGAWTTEGTQIAVSTAVADEKENADSDTSFVSNSSIDDQLVWLAPSLLMNRMISSGKLP
jgi:prepilin-type N-terminal cleavage/methylation domain-containing protein